MGLYLISSTNGGVDVMGADIWVVVVHELMDFGFRIGSRRVGGLVRILDTPEIRIPNHVISNKRNLQGENVSSNAKKPVKSRLLGCTFWGPGLNSNKSREYNHAILFYMKDPVEKNGYALY